MKILILLKNWEGGVGNAILSLKKELEKKGCIIKIISRENDLKIFSLRKSIFPIREKIKNLIKNKEYDIIYTQDWSLAFPLIFPYPIFKKNHFCCFHGNDKFFLSLIFQKLIGKIMGKRLIVVGDALKKQFPRSNLIFNGVDLKKFKPLKGIKRLKNSIGFVNWKTEEYHFNEVTQSAKSLKKRLFIAEKILPEEMPEFYNKIEMLISLPPSYTGFGLTWLEAMASGVPKIIGNRFGIGKKLPIEHIENYRNLKEAISKSKSKNYRYWIKKEGKEYNWNICSEKIIKIFKSSNK